MDKSKVVTIDIIDSQINCQRNNLVLIDSNNNRFDFCRESSSSFTTKSVSWIRMQKTKQCSFCAAPMSFGFQISYSDAVLITETSPKPPTTKTTTTKTTTEFPLFPSQCGTPVISPLLNGLKIVNGLSTTKNSWPWQVMLETADGGLCGASLINDQWLVSAAHCKASVVTAYLGLHDYNDLNANGVQALSVAKFINHPQYDDVAQTNDIALLKLSTPVTYSDSVSPICLPGGRRVQVDDKLIVTGWGAVAEKGATSNILLQTDVRVNPDSVCTEEFGITPLIASQLCAGIQGNQPHDACQGDSGGPLVKRDNDGQFWLAGVVSTGVGCAGHGIYSRVSEFEQWISETVKMN